MKYKKGTKLMLLRPAKYQGDIVEVIYDNQLMVDVKHRNMLTSYNRRDLRKVTKRKRI